MRRIAVLLVASVPAAAAAQGFGVYEHGTCAMARAGVAAASPCPDGSAIFFNPAGLAGLSGMHVSAGVTLIQTGGGFTDDLLRHKTDLDNPIIPVPSGYFTRALNPTVTVGVGVYAPYGLQTRWPTEGFEGRFLSYDAKLRSFYVQPTVGYQKGTWLKVGVGIAFIHSTLELNQRVDLAAQLIAPGITFQSLGVLRGTDFANAKLHASGTGFAVHFGGIIKVNDKLSIGGRWLTKKTITYDGDAVFTPVPTGLTLPPNNPLGLPGGTPVDAILAPQFGTGGPLADGAATTAITLPPQGSIGFAYKMSDKWTILADYQYVVWGWFQSIVVTFQNPATPTLALTPHAKDTHGIRLGTEYVSSDKLTLRGGYLYHTSALPDDFITPLLPEAPRNEVTVGLGYQLTNQWHADLAYQYIKQQDRRGRVFEPSVGNTGLYTFSGNLFGVGLACTF